MRYVIKIACQLTVNFKKIVEKFIQEENCLYKTTRISKSRYSKAIAIYNFRYGKILIVSVIKRLFLFLILIIFQPAQWAIERDTIFLLITIDTWRADYISHSGSNKVQTPFLDKLAKEGIYIKYIDTPCPMTTPAHASILTGLYPKDHGIHDNRNFKLKDGLITMALLFKEKGFKTFAVVSGVPLKKRYGLDKGFDYYDDEELEHKETFEKNIKGSLKLGEQVASKGLSLIKNNNGNIFLWMHLYDPHYPYNPPDEFKKKYISDLYGGEVAYVDSVLKEFFSNLPTNRKYIVIIVGDHGEDLNEHNEETHGILLYNTTRKVPFIFWDSEKNYKPFESGPKSLIDIFPTVVDIFGLRKTSCDGVSMFKNVSNRAIFSETFFPLCFSANPGFSYKKGTLVFIKHGSSNEVYIDDFKEKENIYFNEKEFAKEALAEIKKYSGDFPDSSSRLKLSEEELKILTGLGYIGSSSLFTGELTKCDLKDLARDFTNYTKIGWEMVKLKDPKILLNEYNNLLKKYPYSPLLHCDKAGLLIQMKQYDEALAECKACVMFDKENARGYFWLGNLYSMKGKFKEAENFYTISLNIDPNQAVVHYNLGMINYEKLNNPEKAKKHLQKFLELDPKNQNAEKIKTIIKQVSSTTSK